MKRITILLFTVYFTAICIQQHTVAQPVPVPAGEYFRQEGVASWYGYEFDGRPTASGEIYNSSQFTAAHPTLPFGTILMVTNRQNNRQVAVKVNDRGPFVASRIIDLSRAAAEQLDMLITGTAPVSIEKIPANHPLYTSPSAYLPPQPFPTQALPPQTLQPQTLPPQAFQQPTQVLPPQAFQQPMQALPPPLPGYPPVQQAPVIITQPALPPPQRLPPMAQQTVQAPILVPTPPPLPPETPAAAPYAPITVTVYPPQTPSAAPNPTDLPGPRAKLNPSITPLPNKTYKLQVGSYKVAGNAVDAYVKLKAAGLEPSYERKDDYFRVVLAGIRGTDITSVTGKLGTAGFREAVIREER
jgi:rare lipoprotein A